MQLVYPHASWFWDICELGIGATPLSFEESLSYHTSIMMVCKHCVVGTLVHFVSLSLLAAVFLEVSDLPFWAAPQSRRYL